MVESRRVPNRQPALENQSMTEGLEVRQFNQNQKRAREIISSLDIAQDEKDLLFVFHLWHESGSLSLVQRLTGINNRVDARKHLGKVSDSDELIELYNNFYLQYKKSDDKDEE